MILVARTVLVCIVSAVLASTAVPAAPAQDATYTNCYRDSPFTICVTTSNGRSVGWKRVNSFLLAKSTVTTISTCTVPVTNSAKHNVSVPVSAEASVWILAKVSATVSRGLEKSTSVPPGVSKWSFKQKKGQTYRCEGGYTMYESDVTVRKSAAGSSFVRKGLFSGATDLELRVTKL